MPNRWNFLTKVISTELAYSAGFSCAEVFDCATDFSEPLGFVRPGFGFSHRATGEPLESQGNRHVPVSCLSNRRRCYTAEHARWRSRASKL
jgi:hypothetical protein